MFRPLLVLVPVVALCLTSCARESSPHAPPGVVVSNPDYVAPALLVSEITDDAGPREQVFELINQSGEPRTIRLQQTSCYCVGLFLAEDGKELKSGDEFSLAPGERKSAKMAFKPLAKSAAQSQSAAFECLGPQDEPQLVEVRMVIPVLSDAAASPPVLGHDFTTQPTGPVEKRMVLECSKRSAQPLSLQPHFRDLPSEVKLAQLTPLETREVEPGLWTQSWEAIFAIHWSESIVNTLATKMTVTFGTSPNPYLVVPVTLRQRFGIETLPRVVDFGTVTSGQVFTRKVLLTSPSDRAFTIVKAESNCPQLTVTCNGSKPNPRQWVEVALKADQARDLKAEIILETSHPETPVVKLEVQALCPR